MKKNVFILVIFSLLTQCSKENQTPTPSVPKVDVIATNSNDSPTIVSVPTPPSYAASSVNSFEWENIDFVPCPTPTAPTWKNALVPWAAGTSTGYPQDLRMDYSKASGWVLVYNTFTSQAWPSIPYFVLYNKYRGLIRLYWLHERENTVSPNGPLAHKISLSGNNSGLSSMLNFADQDVIDPQKMSPFASVIENTVTPGFVLDQTWEALEFEIAYDPNVTAQDQSALNFNWAIVGLKGKIPLASLQQEGKDFLLNPTLSGVSKMLVRGYGEALSLQNQGAIDMNTLNALSTDINDFKSSNAIFKDYNINDTGERCNVVRLDVNYNDSWTVNNQFTEMINMAVPGYDQSNTQNLKPNFNEVLGVFNLTDRPSISFQKTSDDHGYTYSLKASSVKYIFNPALTNIADIQNISQTIIASENSSTDQSSLPTIYSGQQLKATQALKVIGVRVSFDVVPKDGSPKYTIVKTFKANVN